MSLKSCPATVPSKGPPPGVKEFTVKLARDIKKKYNVMQFNRGDKIDFTKCTTKPNLRFTGRGFTSPPPLVGVSHEFLHIVRRGNEKITMDRENNRKEFTSFINDDTPTQGAGSEYGKERREEARRKKYGIISKKYKVENQPWILKTGKPEKKYRGKKAGLISENATYYLFTQQTDGTFYAMPVDSWYIFEQSIRHSTLNAEEAEEEFIRRDRAYNYFSLMVQKRLKEKPDEETPAPENEKIKVAKKKTESLTILEGDDYQDLMSSEDESDSSDEEKKSKKNKKGKKASKMPARPKKKDSGSEAEEESDTGDFEGRELDYMSEVSSDEEAEENKTNIMGLDQEMQKIDDEEEEEPEDKAEGEDDKKKDEGGEKKDGEKNTNKESSSSCGSDSEDSDIDDTKIQSSIFMQKRNIIKKPQSSQKSSSKSSSRGGSRPGTPSTDSGDKTITDSTLSSAAVKLDTPNIAGGKRPASTEPRPSKKARTDSPVPSGSKTPTLEVGLTEDVVRRYLMRKPMTTKDLLCKLNPKKTGLTSEEVVKRVTTILRKLNPAKMKIKDKMYWHIKDDSKPTGR